MQTPWGGKASVRPRSAQHTETYQPPQESEIFSAALISQVLMTFLLLDYLPLF